MRKSLLDIQETERYLLRKMTPQEKSVFETNMLAHPEIQEGVEEQRKAMRIVRLSARERQREKLSAVYDELAQDPSFAQTIHAIFH